MRIENIAQSLDQTVTLSGWLYNKRSSKKIHFLQLRDGSATIQCVVGKNDVDEETFAFCDGLTQESALSITGKVVRDERSKLGYEIHASDVKLISPSENYPITPKEHGIAFLLDHRHLWLRSKRQHAIMRIRHTLIEAIRDFFNDRGFINMDPPIFTPNACEGTTTLFETEYFGQKAYLTQSGQLYMEAAAMAHGKVYSFGPTFRAEKSKTRRHLTEFWMVEPEVAFFTLEENMQLAEDFLVHLVSQVLEHRLDELEILERDLEPLKNVSGPFPRLHYTQAVEKLKELGQDIEWGSDFGAEDETVLTKQYDRPITVHHFPTAIKAFYMKEDPKDPKTSLSMDVLAPEGYGEIIGGGQREESLSTLEEKIQAHDLPKDAFEWYLDLRRYGSVPHGGFGLGLERAITWICGLHHLRETIPFPRMMERLSP